MQIIIWHFFFKLVHKAVWEMNNLIINYFLNIDMNFVVFFTTPGVKNYYALFANKHTDAKWKIFNMPK